VLRWHLTLLLSAAALVGVALSPALRAARAPTPPPVPPALDPPPPTVPPATGTDLHLDAHLDRAAVLQGGDTLRYLVLTTSAPAASTHRVPVDVALVVDTSGSMGADGKIEAARAAADELVDALRPGDRFSLVAFDDRARVLVPGAPFDGDTTRLHHIVAALKDDGGTALWDGLESGHAEIGDAQAARKVLVVSDGNANVGETSPAAFVRAASAFASQGVSVSAIGLGSDFNETLLEGMADAGGGAYRFVGNPEELPAVIATELERTTQTVARSARLDVHLAPGVRLREVYGWDTTTNADGSASIYLGDVAAGQARKVVLAVDVPDGTLGALSVAEATLTWAPVEGDSRLLTSAEAEARVTLQGAEVDASRDDAATVAATRARAGVLSRASSDAFRDGDPARARRLLQSVDDLIVEGLGTVDAPELKEDRVRAQQLISLGYAQGDAYAAKAASEVGRDLAR
jgi:Ca-activated chloride channel family protein